jgi:hypothetical protein
MFWILALILAWFGRDGARAQTTIEVKTTELDKKMIVTPATRPRTNVMWSSPDVTADSTGKATLDISIRSTLLSPAVVQDKDRPALFQIDLSWPLTGVSSVLTSIGPAATTAGKTLTCNRVAVNVERCNVSGVNLNVIQDGVVIRSDVVVTATTIFRLNNVSSKNQFGADLSNQVPGVGPTVTFTAPPPVPVIASFACANLDLWPGESTTCTVTLTAAATAGGTLVTITRLSGLDKIVPPNLTITAGQLSGTFQMVAQ